MQRLLPYFLPKLPTTTLFGLESKYCQSSICHDQIVPVFNVKMADAMDVDTDTPRGVKRTAEEAGLPPEAPRRIKAC